MSHLKVPSGEEDPTYCKLMDRVKKLRHEYPIAAEIVLAKGPFYWDNRDITLASYFSDSPQYGYQPKYEDMFEGGTIDRRGCMEGGFPWTCKTHPWPVSDSGKPLSPLVQINLQKIPQPQDFCFPAELIQTWGDDTNIVTRRIALEDIEGVKPSDVTLVHSQEYFLFEPFIREKVDRQIVGFCWTDYCDPQMQFTETCDVDDLMAISHAFQDFYYDSIEENSGFEGLMEEIFAILRTAEYSGGPVFGVPVYRQTTSIEDINSGKKALYFTRSSENGGLSILFDGQMGIRFCRAGDGFKFDAVACR